MKLLLCGGGSGEKNIHANRKFNEIINHAKPLLYVPLALDEKKYDECFEWIHGELKDVDIPFIEMIYSANEIVNKDLNQYCAIFIGGGNTFRLLAKLKKSGAFNNIKKFIENNGVVYGGSAGATIFGYDINVCLYTDKNDIKLKDTRGFNCLSGKSIAAHYTNKSKEKTEVATEYLKKYSTLAESVIALPEEVTIFINDKDIEFIGNKESYCFKKGERKIIDFYLEKEKDFDGR